MSDEAKYVLIYEQGNGYDCGCCRSTSVDYETCEDFEHVLGERSS